MNPLEGGDGINFEGWLARELGQTIGAEAGPSPLPQQAAYHAAHLTGGASMSLLGKLGAALSTKAAAIGAAAALTAGGGTAIAAGALTGGGGGNDGQGMAQVVESCKDQVRTVPASEARNVGQCVSSSARHHGQEKRADGHASRAREESRESAEARRHEHQPGSAKHQKTGPKDEDQPEVEKPDSPADGGSEQPVTPEPETSGRGHGEGGQRHGGGGRRR